MVRPSLGAAHCTGADRRGFSVPVVPDADGDDLEGMEIVEEEFASDDVELPPATVELQTLIDTHASVSLQLRLLERESIDLQHVPAVQWYVFPLLRRTRGRRCRRIEDCLGRSRMAGGGLAAGEMLSG